MAESNPTDVEAAELPAVKTVKARWVGPFEGQLVTGQIVVPGDTVVEIPEPEAIASENWEIVGGTTVTDLRNEAKRLGVDIPKGSKKADIEKLIGEAQAVGSDGNESSEGTED